MIIADLTEESANAAARRLREEHRFHRNAARARLRALERLEAECRRHGIRIVRQPVQTRQGENREPQHPDHR